MHISAKKCLNTTWKLSPIKAAWAYNNVLQTQQTIQTVILYYCVKFWQLSRGPSVYWNCSVTEVAVDSAEYNVKWFLYFLNLPSCCFVPAQFCSPHKSCSNTPYLEVFALSSIAILQDRMASEFSITYGNSYRWKPNFFMTWSTIQTCSLQIRGSSEKPSPKAIGS